MNPGFFVAGVALLVGVACLVTAHWLAKKSAWRDSSGPLLMQIAGVGLLVFSLPTALFIGALVRWL